MAHLSTCSFSSPFFKPIYLFANQTHAVMAYGCRTDRLLVSQSPRTSRKVISAPWPHLPSLHPSLHQSVIRLSHLRPGGPGRLGIFWTSKAVSATSLVLAQSRHVIFCCITFILWKKYKGGTWITATKMVMQRVLISSWDFAIAMTRWNPLHLVLFSVVTLVFSRCCRLIRIACSLRVGWRGEHVKCKMVI